MAVFLGFNREILRRWEIGGRKPSGAAVDLVARFADERTRGIGERNATFT
jgi:DNA-binding transcriptional regulator YiaG